MLLKIIALVFVYARLCNAVVYDRYCGLQATNEQLAKYEALGVTSTCTKDIEPCAASERRRVDGSCNSLDNPMKGTFFEPLRRLLPAHYYNVSYSRKSVDGKDLKLPRAIRKLLLCEGKSPNLEFTQAIPGFGIFGFGDIGSIHDIQYFLINVTNCCTEEGRASPQCTPNIIPEDDQMYRLTGISCLNLTRPLSFSDYGCSEDIEPSPVEQGTGTYDLSPIYNANDDGDSVIRSYKGGKLTVDIDEYGIIWPPNGNGLCAANQAGETRCFGNYSNTLLSVMLFTIWFLRQHNYIATKLAAVNPCWDDDTLFHTARDINIAFYSQVYYYEWLEATVGSEYLIKQGVLSECKEHRDIYDPSSYPHVSLEFTFALRWFHTMQEGFANMYDTDGTFMKEYPMVNFTMRPGLLGSGKNIIHFTQHMYRQPARNYKGVDTDLAHNGLPFIQHVVDVPTSDLHKSRTLGFAPYIDYVHLCTGHKIRSFHDLNMLMDTESVEQMKLSYDHVKDIDFLAGMWLEKPIEGGSVPTTLACVMSEHFKRNIQGDRHWYERADRPYPFTKEQLLEVRKASLARLICTNADKVTEIQPKAFRTISADNPLMPCSAIPSIDFSAWADDSCTFDSKWDNPWDSPSAARAHSLYINRIQRLPRHQGSRMSSKSRPFKPAQHPTLEREEFYKTWRESRRPEY